MLSQGWFPDRESKPFHLAAALLYSPSEMLSHRGFSCKLLEDVGYHLMALDCTLNYSCTCFKDTKVNYVAKTELATI